MSIGYACKTIGVPKTDQKSCVLKNASELNLAELILYNLNSLENIIDYNIENRIKLFRISSDLIPFGSSPVNKLTWWEMYSSQLLKLGQKIQKSGMRVSLHPGQYTVLNSPNEEVVSKSVEDLNYHTRVLDSMGVGTEHKIVLHIGGIYQDKQLAIKRFKENYKLLSDTVKQRLVIENDDKSYNIYDVLDIGVRLNVPVIYDNLHNKINPFDKEKDDVFWINQCRNTWKKVDGKQKIHYSQQEPQKKPGSHSDFICINDFMNFYGNLKNTEIDIMLEVKDKNLSAVKCINCTSTEESIKALELEWSKYKYTILERSPNGYLEICKLLQNKSKYNPIGFYNIIENSLQSQISDGNSINAINHLWGEFKDIASEKEIESFIESLRNYEQGKITISTVKKSLWKMAVKYKQTYLLNSYYFVL